MMPQIEVKEKFAWRPILTTSGKWVWWQRYIKRMKIYWGPAGEGPAIHAEFFTTNEWLLEQIKNQKNAIPLTSGKAGLYYYKK